MKKTPAHRVFSIAAICLLFMSNGVLAAQAVTSASITESCTPTHVNKGLCVTAVIIPGEDPVVAGVVQQLQMGVSADSISKFIEQRGKHVQDSAQAKIQKIVKAYKTSTSHKSKEDALVSEQPQLRNAEGVGTVVGNTLDVIDTVTYMYCSSSTGLCQPSGSIKVDFRMGIEGNLSFSLSADLTVTSGSPVLIEKVGCYTYHDQVFDIDSVVHTWDNCTRAKTSNEVMYRQILIENWGGGSLGEVYHPTYTVRFFNFAGGRFSKTWDGKEYKIADNGQTSWL